MATANDILKRAFRRMKVLAGEETLGAAEQVDGLQVMNDLMYGFGPKGISYAHTTLTGSATVNVPDEQIANLVWLVAEALAPDYGVEWKAGDMRAIIDARNEMQAAYHVQAPAQAEPMLRPHRFGTFDITRLE